MPELLPQTRVRHIHLQRCPDGHYEWTCTLCGWTSPVCDPEDALHAVEDFAKHSCTKGDEFGESPSSSMGGGA